MKKNNRLVLGALVMLLFFAGCKKNTNTADSSAVNGEITQLKGALVRTQAYGDTLKMVFDTAKIHRNNTYCIKYDKLYHRSDSMFRAHYTMFGDEMYKNGMMMSNYTPSAGMMQGGMMNNGSTMDLNLMMGDTATVGGEYRNMHQLNINHQSYHTAIYN